MAHGRRGERARKDRPRRRRPGAAYPVCTLRFDCGALTSSFFNQAVLDAAQVDHHIFRDLLTEFRNHLELTRRSSDSKPHNQGLGAGAAEWTNALRQFVASSELGSRLRAIELLVSEVQPDGPGCVLTISCRVARGTRELQGIRLVSHSAAPLVVPMLGANLYNHQMTKERFARINEQLSQLGAILDADVTIQNDCVQLENCCVECGNLHNLYVDDKPEVTPAANWKKILSLCLDFGFKVQPAKGVQQYVARQRVAERLAGEATM